MRESKRAVKSLAYGECKRSGFRVPVTELVHDGQLKGLIVRRVDYDPKHPQELTIRTSAERHNVIAEELSLVGDENVAAPVITFDDTGKLVFV